MRGQLNKQFVTRGATNSNDCAGRNIDETTERESWVTGVDDQTEFYVRDGAAPDLTILGEKDGGQKCEWKVHRRILTSKSPVWAVMLNGKFKESSQGVIDLNDPEAYHLTSKMLRFMYSGYYGVGDPRSFRPHKHLLEHSGMYALGDMYDMPELKALVKRKFHDVAKRGWKYCYKYDIVKHVFESTPASDTGLREVIVQASKPILEQIFTDERWIRLMREHEYLRKGLVGVAVEKLEDYRIQMDDLYYKKQELRNSLSGLPSQWVANLEDEAQKHNDGDDLIEQRPDSEALSEF